MSFNLLRNARVFFTTNLSSGVVSNTSLTTSNTWEIQVLDGLSFSQATSSETVTINEAGEAPTRGQIAFNTSIEPVDWSFSTYMRPATVNTNFPTATSCEERVLWNALGGDTTLGSPNSGWIDGTTVDGAGIARLTGSNKHQLQKFGLIISMDNATYFLDDCAIESASIDFGIDAIATIAWSGRALAMRQFTSAITVAANASGVTTTITGAASGTANSRNTTAKYLANKLSIAQITPGFGASTGATTYNIAITGGNITIANNLTYLTPANLGVVNEPCAYFTGTRTVSGSLNAYLKTGTGNTAALLSDLLDKKTDDQNTYSLLISLGGNTSAKPRVEVDVDAAQLQIPTISADQVVSTTINFTAQPFTGSAFDITKANEVELKYYSA